MSARLQRTLGLREGLAISAGTMIGSGIFFKQNVLAESLGRLDLILLAWLVAGLLSGLGALVYAELACMYPESGGGYIYVREAYGHFWAFLLSWTELVFMRPAATGALAVAAAVLLGGNNAVVAGTAVGLVATLSILNALTTRGSGRLQSLALVLKVLGLLFLASLPLWLAGRPSFAHSSMSLESLSWSGAFLAVLWAYDGWYNVAVVSEEVKDPQRNIPRALLGGVALVTGLYLLVNLGVHAVLPMEELARSQQPAADAAKAVFGPVGEVLVRILILGSVLGTLNATILCAPRVVLATGRDGTLPAYLSKVDQRFQTPFWAVIFYGFYSCALIGLAEAWRGEERLFDLLTNLVVFAVLCFSVLTAVSLFVLRFRRPEHPRPFRCWGYPWLPALSALSLVALVILTLWERPALALSSLVAVGLGAGVYGLRRHSVKNGGG